MIPSISEYPNHKHLNTLRFNTRSNLLQSKGNLMHSHRSRAYNRDISEMDKIKSSVGATIGTLIPMLIMMKKQGIKNPLKLNYGLWNMVIMSAASIVGGVGFGLIGENKDVRHNRLKEGFFQFMNASIPTWIVGGVVSLCENSVKHNTMKNKIISVIGGLLVGMYGAAALANVISDPKDKYPDRKLTYKDGLANIDDALGVFVLAKFPFADKLKLERFLPLIYASCGYRAGKSN